MKPIQYSFCQTFIDGMEFCLQLSKKYKGKDKDTMQNFVNEIEEYLEQAKLIMKSNLTKPTYIRA